MTYGVGGAGVVPEASTFVNPVAGTRIYLKRSDTQDKKPQTASAEYGELFINYHSNSPMLCFKDNANQIVEIRPLTALELELGELTDVIRLVPSMEWCCLTTALRGCLSACKPYR